MAIITPLLHVRSIRPENRGASSMVDPSQFDETTMVLDAEWEKYDRKTTKSAPRAEIRSAQKPDTTERK